MSWTNTYRQIITNKILGHYKDLRVFTDRQTYIQQFPKSNRKWNVESIYIYKKKRRGSSEHLFWVVGNGYCYGCHGWMTGWMCPRIFCTNNTHSHIPIKTYKCKFMHNLYTFHWSPNQKFKSFFAIFPNAVKKNARNSGRGVGWTMSNMAINISNPCF